MSLLRAFYREYGRKLGAAGTRSFEELEKALAKGGYLKRFVDRILPPLVPERVLDRGARASAPAALVD